MQRPNGKSGKSPQQTLESYGQSIWLDYISRDIVESGKLKGMIDQDCVRGVTSNPTIFQEAISKSTEYDDQFRELVSQGKNADEIFEALTTTDIRNGLDIFRDVYEQSQHVDGRVSIEVTPDVALDAQKTIAQAQHLWQVVDRPNLLVKIPGTTEGIPAIEECLAQGLSINITLLFSVERYQEVMEAYLKALERRVEKGQPIDQIISVASFFVSRVDTMVDKMLQKQIDQANDPAKNQKLQSLLGKAAVANAKIAYEHFQQVFESDRFRKLQGKGAHLQRPLWASTSTKNPSYRDVVYVEELVGPHTVNTMPEKTLRAIEEHGQIRGNTVMEDVAAAHQVMDDLAEAGIDMRDVTLVKLVEEGVQKFAESYDQLMASIRQKREDLRSQTVR